MRIAYYSDLHTEFAPFDVPELDADVVVLAGDIGVKRGGWRFALQLRARVPVVYVAGNHEYYGTAVPYFTEKLRAMSAEHPAVRFLENDEVVIGGVRFLGCTLWTDFMVHGAHRHSLAMGAAKIAMVDYKRIRRSPAFSRLDPRDTVALHRESMTWLRARLEQPTDAVATVIVTHHAPSLRSIAPRYIDDELAPAYASDLEDVVAGSGAALWIHGHTHTCVDYRLGETRVVSNQRGYPDEPVDGFDSQATVTLG